MGDHGGLDPRTDADELLAQVRKSTKSRLLSDVLPGPENAARRQQVISSGRLNVGKLRALVSVQAVPGTDDYEVLHTSAMIHDPGLSTDLIDEIADFANAATKPRQQQIALFWRVYRAEGIIHNAISKLAALLAGSGRFKVRKAKKGKKQKAQEQLQALLDEFVRNVNNAPIDGVVKGGRGLKALTQQAVRQALVEGDWIGRAVWTKHEVPNEGTFSLPMTIQSISMANIEPVEELAGTGIEAYYWVPDQALIRQLENSKDKQIQALLKKYLPKDLLAQLKKNRKVLLDPALLLHVKNGGVDFDPFGESFIEPAIFAIAYKRAVENLDFVTIKSLVNRMVVLKVGSDDKESPYFDASVQLTRALQLQQQLEDPEANMLMIWQGPDLDVLEVGSHNSIQNLDERHRLGDLKIIRATGMPTAILDGTNDGTKSSGMAAMLGVSAALDPLQTAMEQSWTSLGERIAMENGFETFDIVFEFDNSLQLDRIEEWNQRRLDYQGGAMSIRDYLAAIGFDPEAVYLRKCMEKGLEPGVAKWEEVFMPVQGLPGQGAGGPPGTGPGKPPGGGRTPDAVTGKPTPEREPEANTPTEHK